MLQANDAMHHRGQRLAGDLGIAMGHRHRSFFMHAGDELGLGVHAVIDDRFLHAAECRTGTGCDIVDVERLRQSTMKSEPTLLLVTSF